MPYKPVNFGVNWISRRQIGYQGPTHNGRLFGRQAYPKLLDNHSNLYDCDELGGVFGLEYSSCGKYLLAACERKAIIFFDPLTSRYVKTIHDAHTDSVNGIKFLDHSTFATCSDDCSIGIWDVRNTSSKLFDLKGHEKWVKNVEYIAAGKQLISSAFDGFIMKWDLGAMQGDSIDPTKVFSVNGLMRCTLSEDSNKMVISTTSGYMIVVHNLDVHTLAQDLDGFFVSTLGLFFV